VLLPLEQKRKTVETLKFKELLNLTHIFLKKNKSVDLSDSWCKDTLQDHT